VIDARSEAASAAGSRSSVTSVVSAAVSASQRPLERLGRASLFIYWIHVELVYGYASWLWRHRLPFWGTAIAFVGFCALMYGAVVLRDRVVSGRATRPRAVTQAATA
jgi:hypothetical protein